MTIKEVDQVIEEGESLKTLTSAFGELASQKIKKIRSEVERNRLFFDEIFSVFGTVKTIALRKKIVLIKKKKTVSLILTSNYRFNGNINDQLIKFFMLQTEKLDTDLIVIGKIGIDHFKINPVKHPTKTVLLKKELPDTQELNNLVENIRDYNQVFVFYSQLKSLLIQIPFVRDITQSTPPAFAKETIDKNETFIFEPEIGKILQFFDSQIITLLLEQTFLESEVSRTASRLISMDQAQIEANKFLKQQRTIRAYLKRSKEDKMILEGIASYRRKFYI